MYICIFTYIQKYTNTLNSRYYPYLYTILHSYFHNIFGEPTYLSIGQATVFFSEKNPRPEGIMFNEDPAKVGSEPGQISTALVGGW